MNESIPGPDSARIQPARIESVLMKDNSRVGRYADNLLQQANKLFAAAAEQDLSEVRRVTDFIARGSELYGFPEVAQEARQLSGELQKPDNQANVQRGITRLIGTCRQPGEPEAPCAGR